jgi:hypothetical protein
MSRANTVSQDEGIWREYGTVAREEDATMSLKEKTVVAAVDDGARGCG